jgi:NitT/TauT family transport system permease protein
VSSTTSTTTGQTATSPAVTPSAAPRRPRRDLGRSVLPPAAAFVVFIALWQGLVSGFDMPTYLLPGPVDVVKVMGEALPSLVEPTLVTMEEAYLGFLLAAVVGFVVALLMARWNVAERGLYPYMVLLQTIPIVAVAPLLVVWLGAGTATNMVVAAMIAVFPVAANTLTGLKSTDRNLVQLYSMAGAGKTFEMFSLRIPFALPFVFTGLRIAAGSSVIGAIVGEFVAGIGGGRGGLGYVITTDATQLLMPQLFCAVLAASLVSLVLFGVMTLAERLLLRRWHDSALPHDE